MTKKHIPIINLISAADKKDKCKQGLQFSLWFSIVAIYVLGSISSAAALPTLFVDKPKKLQIINPFEKTKTKKMIWSDIVFTGFKKLNHLIVGVATYDYFGDHKSDRRNKLVNPFIASIIKHSANDKVKKKNKEPLIQAKIKDEIQLSKITKKVEDMLYKVNQRAILFTKTTKASTKTTKASTKIKKALTQKKDAVIAVSAKEEVKTKDMVNVFINKESKNKVVVLSAQDDENIQRKNNKETKSSQKVETNKKFSSIKEKHINHTKAGTVQDPFYKKVIIDTFPMLPKEIKQLKQLYLNKEVKVGDNIEKIIEFDRASDYEKEKSLENKKRPANRYLYKNHKKVNTDEKFKNISDYPDEQFNKKMDVDNGITDTPRGRVIYNGQPKQSVVMTYIKLSRMTHTLPETIKVNESQTTTVLFFNRDGKPWPIKQFAFGKPDDFDVSLPLIEKDKISSQEHLSSNILMIKNKKKLAMANLVVTLVSAQQDTMTFVFTLDTAQGTRDLITEIKVLD